MKQGKVLRNPPPPQRNEEVSPLCGILRGTFETLG